MTDYDTPDEPNLYDLIEKLIIENQQLRDQIQALRTLLEQKDAKQSEIDSTKEELDKFNPPPKVPPEVLAKLLKGTGK